jgi:hypothetical protein
MHNAFHQRLKNNVDISGYFFKKEPLKRTYPKFIEPEPIKPLTPERDHYQIKSYERNIRYRDFR